MTIMRFVFPYIATELEISLTNICQDDIFVKFLKDHNFCRKNVC